MRARCTYAGCSRNVLGTLEYEGENFNPVRLVCRESEREGERGSEQPRTQADWTCMRFAMRAQRHIYKHT